MDYDKKERMKATLLQGTESEMTLLTFCMTLQNGFSVHLYLVEGLDS